MRCTHTNRFCVHWAAYGLLALLLLVGCKKEVVIEEPEPDPIYYSSVGFWTYDLSHGPITVVIDSVEVGEIYLEIPQGFSPICDFVNLQCNCDGSSEQKTSLVYAHESNEKKSIINVHASDSVRVWDFQLELEYSQCLKKQL